MTNNYRLLQDNFIRIEQNYAKELKKFNADNTLGENYFMRANTNYPGAFANNILPADCYIDGTNIDFTNIESVKKIISYICDMFEYVNTLYEGEQHGAIKNLLSWTDDIYSTNYMEGVD